MSYNSTYVYIYCRPKKAHHCTWPPTFRLLYIVSHLGRATHVPCRNSKPGVPNAGIYSGQLKTTRTSSRLENEDPLPPSLMANAWLVGISIFFSVYIHIWSGNNQTAVQTCLYIDAQQFV